MGRPKTYRTWTDEDNKEIRMYMEQEKSLDFIAARLSRPLGAVKSKVANIRYVERRGQKDKHADKPITIPDPRLKLEVGKEYGVYDKTGIGRRAKFVNKGRVIEDLDRFYLLDNGNYLFTIHKADFTDYTLKEVI